MREFITIAESVQSEITEKKSKFIANLFYVENSEEAEKIIKEIKRKYFDARHNCIAYRVIEDGNIIEKSSDDGEPSGTAGAPMLNILQKNNLANVLIIVTRYFGGILLGTGGLVRAYSLATTTALDSAIIIKQEEGLEAEFFVDYKELEEVKYHLKNRKINISKLEYFEKVKLIVEGEKNSISSLEKEKLSDRVILEHVKILGKKSIRIE